eukprot:COSAG01_NODE_5667_length_4111_cov_6.282154_6_plen_84_part_00
MGPPGCCGTAADRRASAPSMPPRLPSVAPLTCSAALPVRLMTGARAGTLCAWVTRLDALRQVHPWRCSSPGFRGDERTRGCDA